MILAIRGALHFLRRAHAAEWIRLGPRLVCQICDVGTPTGSGIQGPFTIRQRQAIGMWS